MGHAETTFAAYLDQCINTKEDVEILNGLTQGNHAWEEIHALRCVKFAKIIDLI